MPHRSVAFVVLLAVLCAACGGRQRTPPARTAAAQPGIAKGQPAGAVDLSPLHEALSHLLDLAVERPSAAALLTAAWQGLVAEGAREGIGDGAAPPPTFAGTAAVDFPAFVDAFGRLRAARRVVPDPVRLNNAAATSMAESLHDTHTTFVPAKAFAQISRSEAGDLVTMTGLRIERTTSSTPEVLEVVPGSAADRAGIVAGDRLIAINGQDLGATPPRELSQAIDGPDGSKLSLDIRQPGYARLRTYTLARRTMRLDLVHSTLLPGGVGYLRIRGFPSAVPIQKQVAQALDDFIAASARGIIVDLRGNPGGSLSTLDATLSLFVSQSPLAYLQRAGDLPQPVARAGPARRALPPVMVLVDSGSASSAEMFAAAMQEYHDGTLVGAPTCGCLMGALFFSLDSGAGLEVALERVQTPVLRRGVEHHPLQPDVAVAADARALSLGHDPQLEAGLEKLGLPAATARTVTPAMLAGGG